MKLFSAVLLAVLWLSLMSTSTRTLAQAAGQHGCCTAFSKVPAVNAMFKKGTAVRCRLQSITEGCNINAIVVTWRGRKVCVDSTPRKMRKLLAYLCKARRPLRRGVKHSAKRRKSQV